MKVAMCNNNDFGIWQFRKGLVKALIDRGIEVTLLTPDGPFVPRLKGLGAKHAAVPFYRFNSPLHDLRLCYKLYRVFRAERPDIVHTMSVKANTYGALAAWLAGVPRIVSLVCGAGHAFSKGRTWKHVILQRAVSWLYWLAGRIIARTWFLNKDDLSLFVESGLIDEDKAVLILSEGVNLRDYSPDNVDAQALARLRAELGIDASTRVVLMLARLNWSKGVRQFVEASQCAAQWGARVVFLLVGPPDPGSPDAVPVAYLQSKSSSHFIWRGFRQDVKELLSLADIVTLPSFYREGVPRSLLEGLAMKKPIVTTDNVGCREVVDEGKNGFLVPVKDSAALASAIETLVHDRRLCAAFGRHSRAKAQAEFDESLVVERVLAEVYGLDDQGPVWQIREAA